MPLSTEAKQLAQYMSALSEEAYCAGWMHGLEYALWTAVVHGPYQYGLFDLNQTHIDRLRELSKRCGGWIIWDEKLVDEAFIPIELWEATYAKNGPRGP